MRVLIDQQFHLGHHYQYLGHLLPGLTAATRDVVVALTPEGRASKEFEAFLAPLADTVTFEAVLPPASPWVPMNERWRVHKDLRRVVRSFAPDYVLIPSGDAQTTAMAAFRVAGLGNVPGRTPCEVGIHFGSGMTSARTSTRLRDQLNLLNLAMSGARRVHVVNFLFYELARRSAFRRVFSLMPHPVLTNPRVGRVESRRLLGIPEAGRYIGLAASIDSRKAIPEFLAAFKAAARPDERVLLAGWINDTHWQTIRSRFSDLMDEGRLITMRRFLSQSEFQTALSALDVVCTPYPRFAGLSSTLLEGVAAGRPILADRFGWSQAAVDRFQLGWTCDVLDPRDFAQAIRRAFDESESYRQSAAALRLLAFHTAENFAEHWLLGVRQKLGRDDSHVKTWEWVTASLVDDLSQREARAC